MPFVLECVVNISEGQEPNTLDALRRSCSDALLDVHTDPFHHRSVFTLAGTHVEHAARSLATEAVRRIDIREHVGVHPRTGVVDVVPFVPLAGSTMADAAAAQIAFAEWISSELHIPAFLYGADRSLPELRKGMFTTFPPEFGPTSPHPSAGAVAVGQRPILIAYNLWLGIDDIQLSRAIARTIRRPGLRTLGLDVGGTAQVSCNIIDVERVGPELVYDLVQKHAPIDRAELVGLLPHEVLVRQTRARWPQLDIGDDKTIAARLSLMQGKTGSD
jgi:glutamate formiminotransferase / 5-formyltetrahydrofolate cyclo-ligase